MPEAAVFQRWFIESIIADQAPNDTSPSFAVYRNTWLKGLLDALDANYPTVAMILGAELFEAVALRFVRDRPARTSVLALYGEGFPDFLVRLPVSKDIPYLRDVAALERLWTECFFAPDAVSVGLPDYAAIGPTALVGLRLNIHPATRFMRFGTPAVTIWQAHRVEGAFQEIEPEWKAERVLVTRRAASILVDHVDEATFHLLERIQRGQALGSAIAETATAYPRCDPAIALNTIISSAALVAPFTEEARTW